MFLEKEEEMENSKEIKLYEITDTDGLLDSLKASQKAYFTVKYIIFYYKIIILRRKKYGK